MTKYSYTYFVFTYRTTTTLPCSLISPNFIHQSLFFHIQLTYVKQRQELLYQPWAALASTSMIKVYIQFLFSPPQNGRQKDCIWCLHMFIVYILPFINLQHFTEYYTQFSFTKSFFSQDYYTCNYISDSLTSIIAFINCKIQSSLICLKQYLLLWSKYLSLTF